MEAPIYKYIPNTNEKYMIGSDAKIIKLGVSRKRRKNEMPKTEYAFISYSKLGYGRVNIQIDGKNYSRSLHRLVLETFKPIENSQDYQIHHIDGNPANNNLYNLEWLTPSQHQEKHKEKKRNKYFFIYDITTDKYYNGVREAAFEMWASPKDIYEALADYKIKVNGHTIVGVNLSEIPTKK